MASGASVLGDPGTVGAQIVPTAWPLSAGMEMDAGGARRPVEPTGNSPGPKRPARRELVQDAGAVPDVPHLVLVQEVNKMHTQMSKDAAAWQDFHDTLNDLSLIHI